MKLYNSNIPLYTYMNVVKQQWITHYKFYFPLGLHSTKKMSPYAKTELSPVFTQFSISLNYQAQQIKNNVDLLKKQWSLFRHKRSLVLYKRNKNLKNTLIKSKLS